jgi:hypothetical protein
MEKTLDELQAFVDRLTVALGSLVEGVMLVARDEVAELLSQYNEIVPPCNERLQHCAALLGRGLRDEALGYEADEPGLLATVDLLDLAGRPQWNSWLEALRSLGFPEPPMPKVEVAAAIREAQDARDRLKPLLDVWRRYNLANAPLPMRITILRRLRNEDPNNEAWFECLKDYEKQRTMEMEAELRGAVAANDEETLARIVAELQAPWLEPPSSRVHQTAETALATIRGSRIDKDIEQVSGGLAAALEARDLDAARTLRDRWNRGAEQKGAFSVDDTRFAQAAPALEWLGRHDRLESLFSEVWQSLDARPANRSRKREWVRGLARMRDEVEDLAEQLRDEIDLEPIERLRARVARVEEDQRREETGRRRLMILAVGASTAVAVGAVATTVSILRHNDRVAQALAEVDGILKKVNVGELSPEQVPALDWPDWLKAEPVVQSRLAKLDAVVKEEKGRRTRLTESLAKLGEMLDTLARAPRAASFEPWPEPFVAATKLVVELTDSATAKSADDKAAVAKADGRLQNAAKRFQRDADELLDTRVKEIAAKVAALKARAKSSPGEVGSELAALDEEATTLRSAATATAAPGAVGAYAQMTKASRIASQPLREAGAIASAIADVKQSIDEWRRFEMAEKAIHEAVGDWPRYAERLSAAAAEFPGQAIARDYGEAAKDVELWSATEEWNRFAASFQHSPEISQEDARAAVEALAKIRPVAARFGFEQVIDQFEPVLKIFAERDSAAVKEKLETWIASEWLGEIEWQVTVENESDAPQQQNRMIFFCLQEPKGQSFQYLTGFKDGADNWPAMKRRAFQPTTDKADRSPQKKLADELEKSCLSLIPSRAHGLALDDILVDAVQRTLKEPSLEPCLRLLTLRKIFSVGKTVSILFQSDGAKALLDAMDDGMGGVPGMEFEQIGLFVAPDREDKGDYNKVRKMSERLLNKAQPIVNQLGIDSKARREAMKNADFQVFECVGRLGRDSAGGVVFISRAAITLTAGDELHVIDADGRSRRIGKCRDDGRAVVDARSLIAGLPVFLLK